MKAVVEAFNRRDIEMLETLLPPDAEIVPTRAAIEGTVYRGSNAAAQWYAAVDASWEGLTVEIRTNGDLVRSWSRPRSPPTRRTSATSSRWSTRPNAELGQVGAGRPEVVAAEAGYWHKRQIENVVAGGIQVLVAPDSGLRKGATRPGWNRGLYDFMRRVLQSDPAARSTENARRRSSRCSGRSSSNRGITRFRRRGKAACRAEWRLITATQNLLKLHNHRTAAAAA